MVRNDSDTAWKEILDIYFKQCVDYCFPSLSELVCWEKKWISLDKELQTITKRSESGKCLLDKLIKVHLKNGEEQWILIHIEVRGHYDEHFARRMFTYAYRIFDKYQRAVVSCAVLTDNRIDWRPNSYKIGLAGSYLSSKFLTMKILDFNSRRSLLEQSDNPFASVLLVQLIALDIKQKSDQDRLNTKFALTKMLYEKNYTKNQINNLYRFIDWLIGLPESFEIKYANEIQKLEEEKNMAYICSIERLGIKKGLQQGMLKAALILLRRGIDEKEIMEETGLTTQQLSELKEKEKILA